LRHIREGDQSQEQQACDEKLNHLLSL
jgi:hypothetical protein